VLFVKRKEERIKGKKGLKKFYPLSFSLYPFSVPYFSAMSSESWAVECRAVEFAPPGLNRPVLSEFSLQVAQGEIVVLLGESGSGKTTALRLINGLTQPDAGEVCVEGHLTSQWDAIELRRHIGYVLQDDGLFPHFSVAQNIALVPELLGWDAAKIEARALEMLELVNLPPGQFAGRSPSQLSGGQRQRVGIARALAADQSILLLDEPFGRLDPLTRENLRDEFEALCRRLGKTAIFVTHDLREALLLGDKIALLRDGKLAFFGTPQQFALSDDADVKAYRATLDLPAWMAVPDDDEPPTSVRAVAQTPDVEVKEPGLRAKLQRAGRRMKSKF